MAFNRGNTLKVTYTLRDRSKKTSFTSFHIGELAGQLPNPNEAEFQAFVAEFGSSLAALSDCYVEGISCTFDFFNDAAMTFGTADDVERKAVITFKTEDNFSSMITIPGAKYAMFGSNGIDIIRDTATGGNFNGNPLESHLESIHDKIVNGVTINLATHPVTDRREKNIVSMIDAYKQHRKNPRG